MKKSQLIDLDPRFGEGEKIADEFNTAYQKAFDAFAGPREFRHNVNYPDYHRAGLLGIFKLITEAEDENT
jgi:hypothetical protein